MPRRAWATVAMMTAIVMAVLDSTFTAADRDALLAQRRSLAAQRDRMEAELAGNQFDLVEVETLIDGDHEAERLEREAHDLRGGHAEDLREFGDRDELVDAHGLPFALGGDLALLFEVAGDADGIAEENDGIEDKLLDVDAGAGDAG